MCATFATNATSSPSQNTAFQQHVLRHVARAAVGVVVEDDVALFEGVEAELLDRPFDGELDRPDLRRAELCLGKQVAAWIEDDAREVERLVEDGRVRGRHHRHAHIAATARQVIVDDGQRDLVDHRCAHSPTPVSIRSAPCRSALNDHARLDEHRRSLLLDHRRAGDRLSLLERRAVHDRCLDEATAAHVDVAARPLESAVDSASCDRSSVRPPADRGHLEADELDHLVVDR